MNDEFMKMIERQVAMNVVMKELMWQEARRLGVVIGQEEIIEELKKESVFHDSKLKRFSPSVYESVLKANDLEPREFERDLSQSLASNRFRDILEWSASVSKAELEDIRRIENKSFNLKILSFDADKLLSNAKWRPSNTDLQNYFEKNRALFRSEEKRKVEYLSLDTSKTTIDISDLDIESYFKTVSSSKNGDSKLGQGVQARALHILISDTSDKGFKRLQELAKTLRSETLFRAAAQQISEDFSNASKGGDLGYFGKDTMVKPFSDVVFSSKSAFQRPLGPIKTDYGHHLIWIMDRTPAEVSLKARRNQVAYLLEQERRLSARDALRAKAQAVVTSKKNIAEELSKLGFSSPQSVIVDRKTPGVLPFILVQAALSGKLNEWVGPEEAGDSLMVIRPTESVAAEPLRFEQAIAQVRQKWQAQRVEELVREFQALASQGKKPMKELEALASSKQELKSLRPFQNPLPAPLDENDILAKASQELSAQSPISAPLFNAGTWTLLVASQFKSDLTADALSAKESTTAKKGTSAKGSAKDSVAQGKNGENDSLAKLREEVLSRKRSAFYDAYSQKLLQEAKIPDSFRKQYQLEKI